MRDEEYRRAEIRYIVLTEDKFHSVARFGQASAKGLSQRKLAMPISRSTMKRSARIKMEAPREGSCHDSSIGLKKPRCCLRQANFSDVPGLGYCLDHGFYYITYHRGLAVCERKEFDLSGDNGQTQRYSPRATIE